MKTLSRRKEQVLTAHTEGSGVGEAEANCFSTRDPREAQDGRHQGPPGRAMVGAESYGLAQSLSDQQLGPFPIARQKESLGS